jgi:hypothetical protein
MTYKHKTKKLNGRRREEHVIWKEKRENSSEHHLTDID